MFRMYCDIAGHDIAFYLIKLSHTGFRFPFSFRIVQYFGFVLCEIIADRFVAHSFLKDDFNF